MKAPHRHRRGAFVVPPLPRPAVRRYDETMSIDELLAKVSENVSVRRVFGEPIRGDGALVVPVAWVAGGGGGGGGTDSTAGQEGSGGGLGLVAGPVGAYRVADGQVTWHPAVHVTAIVLGAQVLAAVVALAVALRRRR